MSDDSVTVTPAIGMTKPTVAFLLCVRVLLDTDTEVVDLLTENLKKALKQMCAKRPGAEGGYLTVIQLYHMTDRNVEERLDGNHASSIEKTLSVSPCINSILSVTPSYNINNVLINMFSPQIWNMYLYAYLQIVQLLHLCILVLRVGVSKVSQCT